MTEPTTTRKRRKNRGPNIPPLYGAEYVATLQARLDRLGVLDTVLKERRHHPDCPYRTECNCWLSAALNSRHQADLEELAAARAQIEALSGAVAAAVMFDYTPTPSNRIKLKKALAALSSAEDAGATRISHQFWTTNYAGDHCQFELPPVDDSDFKLCNRPRREHQAAGATGAWEQGQ